MYKVWMLAAAVTLAPLAAHAQASLDRPRQILGEGVQRNVQGNFADAEGGIEVGLSGFTISHSTLAGNTAHATQVSGVPISVGALTVTGGPGTVELSTIAGNTADASPVSAFSIAAGGIYMELATTALRSSICRCSSVPLNLPPSRSRRQVITTGEGRSTSNRLRFTSPLM